MEDNRKYVLDGISIAIVDDHEVVLEGYKSFLIKNGVADIEAYGRAQQLLDRVRAKHFNIYIVDVELPDMDAYSLIDAVRSLQPDAKFIINTIHDEPWTVSKLTEKHVDGVVYKSGNLSQLIEALEAVVYGRQYYCGEFKKIQHRLQARNDIPTSRELDILRYIARGNSTKDISHKLFISENTVENHRKNLFRKLQAKNMADLIVKAIAAGYLEISAIKKRSQNP